MSAEFWLAVRRRDRATDRRGVAGRGGGQAAPPRGGGDGGGSDVDNSAADYSLRYYITFGGGLTTSTFSVHRVKFGAANQLLESGTLTLAAPATPAMPLTGIVPPIRM